MDLINQEEYKDLLSLTEAELEKEIDETKSNKAKYLLGIKYQESEIATTKTKGINFLREAASDDHVDSQEYLAYHDIRFEKVPNLKRIMGYLESVIENKNSIRAFNTLAEFYVSSGKDPRNAKKGFELYKKSAELGDLIANYWVGVCLHRGYGCDKDVKQSIEYLQKGSDAGNAQADFELYDIYSHEESFEDLSKAYTHFSEAVEHGIIVQEHAFMKKNFDEATNEEIKEGEVNLKNAYVNEIMKRFANAINTDRLYKRAPAFMSDGMIWMLKIQKIYFVDTVLHYSHADFVKALEEDIPPLLSEVGIVLFEVAVSKEREAGNKERMKKYRTCLDIIKKIIDDKGSYSIEYFKKEGKYHLMNRYSPKKCADQQKFRDQVKFNYSFKNYARPEYFNHVNQVDKDAESEAKRFAGIRCSSCGCPQGTGKHKICSACKQRYYCSVDCQKEDWKKKHKVECKELRNKK